MKHYEQLTGAAGGNIRYREAQKSARDLFPKIRPHAVIADTPAQLESAAHCDLTLRIEGPSTAVFTPGQDTFLTVDIGPTPVYGGPARIAAVDPTPTGDRLTLNLEPDFFPLERAVDVHRKLVVRAQLDGGLFHLAGRVDPHYKALCGDIVHTLRGYRAALDDAALSPEAETRAELFEHVREMARADWQTAWESANALCAPLMAGEPERLRATKRYTETVVTKEMLDGAIIARSYLKPLGYPGDHRVMHMAYTGDLIGDTPYARLVHALGLEPAGCIFNRMKMVENDIRRLASTTEVDRPLHIANLGCGTAQEVQNLVADTGIRQPIHFTLIDQDDKALEFVHRATRPGVAAHDGRMRVDGLHASFVEMLKAGRVFGQLPPQDYIYSVGLLDYLNAKRCRALVNALYAQLAPGGWIAIANMKAGPASNLWPMEFLTDWSVIFRTADDMYAMAEDLSDATVSLEDDPSHRVIMLRIRKPYG